MAAVRPVVFANHFYPGDPNICEQTVASLFASVSAVPAAVGGVVPHAGWYYSGEVAARTIAGIAGYQPETVVIFGAVHVPDFHRSSLYAAGLWETPLGPMAVDAELAERIANHPDITIAPGAHRHEHSIEVELPLLRDRLPDVRIVPLMVRPGPWAPEIGRVCAEATLELGRRVVFLASTDLTHYGPSFGFEPRGHGEEGIRWAKEVNDRRLIALIAAGDAKEVVPEATLHHNACGPGAVAALLGAMEGLGLSKYVELCHTTSAEREQREGRRTLDSVGYEAGIFPEI